MNQPFADRIAGNVTVTGWGAVGEGSSKSKVLQGVTVPLVNYTLCSQSYLDVTTLNSNVHICAGLDGGGKDACQGDSGGPLVQKEADGKNYLVGVVSFGLGCARPKYYGIYTRVSTYVNWIHSIVS
ncbi:unnamed protein product [Darwinula stevensoni]|uniref:Vitamin K-dependent protein C n=1 Tax=Darwinula stevensoni TaxID=69355 RepID=A0A7R9AB31_9CRUS|nr:unnamed protein product [Darwinula stevensoni]CAG0899025.1 unnamed protein product [Darwinula stevensoni]